MFNKFSLGEQITCLFAEQHIQIPVKQEHEKGRYPKTFFEPWFDDGINCEILKTNGKGWQKGKVRINLNISVEFCPDEPDVE